jgi:hypothetical protein
MIFHDTYNRQGLHNHILLGRISKQLVREIAKDPLQDGIIQGQNQTRS